MGHEHEEKDELLWFGQRAQNATLTGEVWELEVQSHVLDVPLWHLSTCLGHSWHMSLEFGTQI